MDCGIVIDVLLAGEEMFHQAERAASQPPGTRTITGGVDVLAGFLRNGQAE